MVYSITLYAEGEKTIGIAGTAMRNSWSLNQRQTGGEAPLKSFQKIEREKSNGIADVGMLFGFSTVI